MSIRKLWLLLLMFTAVISITINTFLLSILTDKYFKDYVSENYKIHFEQIVEYSKKALTETDFSYNRMNMEMETHLIDPIVRIKLYDPDGNTIVDVETDSYTGEHGMMGDMMGPRYDPSLYETDRIDLKIDDEFLGRLDITRYGSVTNSAVAKKFKSNLFLDSIYSTLIVLFIALLIGIYISRKMSKGLVNTAKIAREIDLGIKITPVETKIHEIDIIQKSLDTLSTRIRLKNKKRKMLIDELMHQARTPLTILKTHLEGFSDNVIDITPEEIKICDDQIENITSIISNMGNMIDAGYQQKDIKPEEFELNTVLKQIVNGLTPQFKKKKIDLKLAANIKVTLTSDRYIFSQIIYNILTNSYKYTGAKGNVKVDYEVYHDSIAVWIEDDGQGISEKDINKIFDAYYRGNSDENTFGEGLGLYFVKENIDKLHGEIKVSSKIGHGSRFTITLPRR